MHRYHNNSPDDIRYSYPYSAILLGLQSIGLRSSR